MTWAVLLLVGVVLPAALYGLSVLLDRRTVRRGGRPWRRRREIRALDRAARTQPARTPWGFLSGTKRLSDTFEADEGRHRRPPRPKDLAP